MGILLAIFIISTHALREEGDPCGRPGQQEPLISTHALREEGDVPRASSCRDATGFLPTPSARRATTKFALRYN